MKRSAANTRCAPPAPARSRPKTLGQHAAAAAKSVSILADSGYLVGLFNPKDHHHARCKAFFSAYSGQTTITWAVFTEVCALLTHGRQKAFFSWADKAQALGYLRIESPPADAVATLWNMMDKYDDLPIDFSDASLVYLAISL